MAPSTHPETSRRIALAVEPAAPAFTYYRREPAARVELSSATLDNWVAKVANLLRDEYDLQPGEIVEIDLTAHWQLPVWCAAVWGLGAVVAVPGVGVPVRLRITSEDRGTDWTPSDPATQADTELLVCSNHPLGLPLARPPLGAIDALADVRSQPDSAALLPPDPDVPLLMTEAGTESGNEALTRVGNLLGGEGGHRLARVLVATARDTSSDEVAMLIDQLILVPAFLAASVVLAVDYPDSDLDEIAAAEGVDLRFTSD